MYATDATHRARPASSPLWRRAWRLGFVGFLPRPAPELEPLRVFLLFFPLQGLIDLGVWLRRRARRADARPRSARPPARTPPPAWSLATWPRRRCRC